MMASEDKKTKADPAAKSEASPDKASTSGKDQPKAESGDATATSTYSRGEGQKPVSKAYIDNWNAIFAKKKKK
jgi:hypothetical protein